MECGAMKVAGLGFRAAANERDLADALALAEGASPVDALATIATKVAALQTAFPHRKVIAVEVAGVDTPSQSQRIQAMHGTGSVAEAAALVAAGPGARLITARRVIGRVTIAVAETDTGDSV
jgi:cobalt-precorrin 5A hydrolase